MSVWGWVALFYIVQGWVDRIAPPTPYTTEPGTFHVKVAACFDGPKRAPPNLAIVAVGTVTVLFIAWATGNLI